MQALIPEETRPENKEDDSKKLRIVPLSSIEPNPDQPRKHFDQEALEELSKSIQEHGIIQPLVVRPIDQNRFQLVVGERRWRASHLAGLESVPVVVRDWDDQKTAEISLIENIQRRDLNPLEEALAFRSLLNDFHLTQEQLAVRVGKSRSYITNSLRLLQLPVKLQQYLVDAVLTMGHAKAILALQNQQDQNDLADEVIDKGLNVRQTEELVKCWNQPMQSVTLVQETQQQVASTNQEPLANHQANLQQVPVIRHTKKTILFSSDEQPKTTKVDSATQSALEANPEDHAVTEMAERLRSWLKTAVKIKSQGQQGHIEISFYSHEDLQRIIDSLMLQDNRY
ncbi:ParB/RepB/Spo0J family partition protein [Heliophilum fasciatum]|uniref:ParB/RepB/Spo0J family partition protein n=1 Tax=Heliophilum fasciatum TaxID=35700 RepID=UPI0014052379|nr:ParB/RepB/Spo0J family partition protein [Heliophilum fasciatum]MCW2278271.1 ParB family chromosome partitioning protein [Heliophilum fasciatum]